MPDYTQIDDPYNNLIERESFNFGNVNPEQNIGEPIIEDRFDLGPKTVQNESFNDLRISNSIKSRGYQPKKLGFFLDGKTGMAEFTDLFLAGGLTVTPNKSSAYRPNTLTSTSVTGFNSQNGRISHEGFIGFPSYYHCSDFDERLSSDTPIASTVIANAYWAGSGTNGTQTLRTGSGDIDQNSYVDMETTTTGSSNSVLTFGREFDFTSANLVEMEARFRISDPTNTRIEIGWRIKSSITHYVAMVFDTTIDSANIYHATNLGSGEIGTDTLKDISVSVWWTVRVSLSNLATHTGTYCYINNDRVGFASYNPGVNDFSPYILINNQTANENKQLYLDYVKVWATRNDNSAVS